MCFAIHFKDGHILLTKGENLFDVLSDLDNPRDVIAAFTIT